MPFPFTPAEEDSLDAELEAAERRFESTKASVSFNLANAVTDFYKTVPDASPAAIIAAARAYTSGAMDEGQAKTFLQNVMGKEVLRMIQSNPGRVEKKEDKPWWQTGNIFDVFPAAVRWGGAGLQWSTDVAQNLAGSAVGAVYNISGQIQESSNTGKIPGTTVMPTSTASNDFQYEVATAFGGSNSPYTPGTFSFEDAFWDATLLGQAVQNPELMGEGWFPNARIYELQAEEARKLRGTIDGKALTAGRGLAAIVAQPGSREYNILSGLVDAAVAIKTPAIPGGGAIAQLAKTEVGAKIGLRTLAGLTEKNSVYIVPSKVAEFLDTKAGQSVVNRIARVKDVDEAIRLFPSADAKFWKGVVEVTDDVTARQFLNDTLGLGDITRGIGPKKIDSINISRWDEVKREIPYFGTMKESKAARLFNLVPGRQVVVEGGSDRVVAQSIKNVNGYLLQARVPRKQRIDIVNRLTDAFVLGDGSIRNVAVEIEEASRAAMSKLGVSDELNDILHKSLLGQKEILDRDLLGAVDDIGTSADMGGTWTWFDDAGDPFTAGHPLMTAGTQSEMLKHSVFLPDPQRVRRIAARWSPIQKITTKQGFLNPEKLGDLRTPAVALLWAQNWVWRPITLLTGGYVLRNMSDSLLRQSFSPGVKTGMFHPFELIQVALHKKFKGDIWGMSFKGDPEDLIRSGQTEMAEAVSGSMRETYDPVKLAGREKKTGVWRRVRRGDGIQEFSKAVAAEISLLYTDNIARLVADGSTTDEILDWMRNTPEGRKHVDRLQNMWKNRTIVDVNGQKRVGSVPFKNADGTLFEDNARGYIDNYIRTRIEKTTGGSPLLRQVIATGKYTDPTSGKERDALVLSRTGEVTEYKDGFFAQINKIADDPNVKLKDTYKAQITLDVRNNQGKVAQIGEAFDRAVDIFFSELYPKREAFLNRSPVFRQEYYNVVGKLADELAPGEAAIVKANIQAAAKAAGETFNKRFFFRYIGNDVTAKKLWGKADGSIPSNGRLAFSDLDAYAKGAALDTTKELFYNAAERSNFADIMAIISPFGSAWAEVMRNWTQRLTSDPESFKRGYVSVQGLRNADPDNDGRGFFYTDPVTGEYVFQYPFGSKTIPLMGAYGAGVVGGILGGAPGLIGAGAAGYFAGQFIQDKFDIPDTRLVAPAKTLNMGFNILPGLGPYAQAAASWILRDKPQFDDVRKFLAPYGSPQLSLLPNPPWWQKMWSAATGDPDNDRFMGDMTMQVMEALAASGEYDLSTEADMQRLQDDATAKARVLLMMRAIGQFVGPTRPVPQVKAPLSEEARTKTIVVDGETIDLSKTDIFSVEISKWFREQQDKNYDTAVEVLLDTFGDDFMLYAAGKTKAVVGGLDASTEFGKWERSNQDFFKTYDEIAGYFAPVGSKFDYQVYLRQLENGSRVNLTPQEQIEEAQRYIGTSIYRRLIRAAGPNPNAEQEAILRRERERLYDEYPGFAKASIDVRAFDAKMNVLYEATFDPRMDDNEVALATREYLNVRDKALEVAAQRGFTLKAGANKDLTAILRAEGERLSSVYPDFGRLWERLLLQEVDLDSEG
jgi:hypothetical protein